MESNYIVYKHTSPSNKVYIGITSKTLEERGGTTGCQYFKNKNSGFSNAIKKYGWNNFKHEILLSGLTQDEACEMEQFYIKKFNSNDRKYGYNLTSGGEKHFEFNEEIRKMLSQKAKEQWENPIIRAKMIKKLKTSHIGVMTEIQQEANVKRRGKPLSEEHILKLKGHKVWNDGKKGVFSKEALDKMSKAKIGKSPTNKGTCLTKEQKTLISQKTKLAMANDDIREKIVASNQRRKGKTFKYLICQYDKDKNLIAIHKGEANASRATNVSKSAIHRCVSGKTKTSGGFIWVKVSKEVKEYGII